MSKLNSDILDGLKKVSYLRRERTTIIITHILGAIFLITLFSLLQDMPQSLLNPDTIIYALFIFIVVMLSLSIFNAVRFIFVKCPHCRMRFNSSLYLISIRKGSALECKNCKLSLSELPEYKLKYRKGEDLW
jgi:hypothetical protein